MKLFMSLAIAAVLFGVQLVSAAGSPTAYPHQESAISGQINPAGIQFNVYNGGSITDFDAFDLRTSCSTRYYTLGGPQFPATEALVTNFIDLGISNGVHQYSATSTIDLTGIDAGHYCTLTVLENGHKIQNTNTFVTIQ